MNHICLDIDDTITYAPTFFLQLVASYPEAQVTVVTFRSDYDATKEYLDSICIRFDRLIVSTDETDGKKEGESLHEWKANYVNRIKPDIFFEDMPEVVGLIDPDIAVFMPCDSVIRDWIRSKVNV